MSDDFIHQPHDKLFKVGFGDPATTAAFLSDQLPEPLSQRIAWETLRLEPGTFVDSQYRRSECDLLFAAESADRPCLVYLLFEHQTTEDPGLPLRLLRYMVRIWEQRLREMPDGPLPPILPVVLAQSASEWNVPSRFGGMFPPPGKMGSALAGSVPDFDYHLIQLATLPYEAIRGTPAGVLVLRAMKAERSGELLGDPVWDEALMARVSRELLDALIRYILQADLDAEKFRDNLARFQNQEIKNSVMTLEQKIRQEGRQEGRQAGRLEAEQDSIIRTLGLRFGEVPGDLRCRIKKVTDEARLTALFEKAIVSGSLDEFSRGF